MGAAKRVPGQFRTSNAARVMSMFKRKALRRRDPIPRREGPYLFDWLKPGDILQIARMEKEFFPQPYNLAALIWLALMPNTYYIVIRRTGWVAYIGFRLFETAPTPTACACTPTTAAGAWPGGCSWWPTRWPSTGGRAGSRAR